MWGTAIFLEIVNRYVGTLSLTSQCALGNALNLSLLWRHSTVYFAAFKVVCIKLAICPVGPMRFPHRSCRQARPQQRKILNHHVMIIEMCPSDKCSLCCLPAPIFVVPLHPVYLGECARSAVYHSCLVEIPLLVQVSREQHSVSVS